MKGPQMRHTPTPWKVLDYTQYGEDHKITNDAGNDIAIIPHWYDEAKEEARANARFIVQACNNHDELVEVLNAFVSAIDESRNNRGTAFFDQVCQPYIKAKAALLKATGEQQ